MGNGGDPTPLRGRLAQSRPVPPIKNILSPPPLDNLFPSDKKIVVHFARNYLYMLLYILRNKARFKGFVDQYVVD